MRLEVQGLDLRIVRGKKFPGDLVLEMYARGEWEPVAMEVPIVMCDFMADNERAREAYMPSWRSSGDGYFMTKLKAGIKHGWKPVADEIRRQRERLGTAP